MPKEIYERSGLTATELAIKNKRLRWEEKQMKPVWVCRCGIRRTYKFRCPRCGGTSRIDTELTGESKQAQK